MGTQPVNSADLEFIHANISKAIAETMKIGAETAKIQAESRYYPIIALGTIAIGALGGMAALAACVIKVVF